MELTYELKGEGYLILKNGAPWISQQSYHPYPGENAEESAKNHIDNLKKSFEDSARKEKDENDRVEAIENSLAARDEKIKELEMTLGSVLMEISSLKSKGEK